VVQVKSCFREQPLTEAIQPFSLDALAGTVPLDIDLDVAALSWPTPSAPRGAAACPATTRPRHSPAPVPQHWRDPLQPWPRDRGPAQPAHLLTRPAPGHRALVGQPHPALRMRLT